MLGDPKPRSQKMTSVFSLKQSHLVPWATVMEVPLPWVHHAMTKPSHTQRPHLGTWAGSTSPQVIPAQVPYMWINQLSDNSSPCNFPAEAPDSGCTDSPSVLNPSKFLTGKVHCEALGKLVWCNSDRDRQWKGSRSPHHRLCYIKCSCEGRAILCENVKFTFQANTFHIQHSLLPGF